jgi:hypothetical protein
MSSSSRELAMAHIFQRRKPFPIRYSSIWSRSMYFHLLLSSAPSSNFHLPRFFRSISTLQAVRGWSAIPFVLSRPFVVQVLRHLFIFPSPAHSTNANPPKNLDLSTNFTRGNPTYVSVSCFHVRDLGTIPTRHTHPVSDLSANYALSSPPNLQLIPLQATCGFL